MTRLTYILSFLSIAPATIAISLTLLLTLNTPRQPQLPSAHLPPPTLSKSSFPGAQIYAALPSHSTLILGQPILTDARTEIIRQYLHKYNSPLEPFAETLVQASDKYGFDFRLTTAIAQQESNLCKKIPADSYNCWGWGIHSQGTLKFTSYPEAIEAVSLGLKEDYIQQGLVTAEQIMSKYTPYSSGSWTLGVNQFLAEME